MDNRNVDAGRGERRAVISTPEISGVQPGENGMERMKGGVEYDRGKVKQTVERGMVENLGGGPVIAGRMPGLATMPPVLDDGGKTVEEKNPEVAVDGNKIEQKWVERTEEVIKRTKGDPREKEVQVNELKADYLAKRFNRRLGDRN